VFPIHKMHVRATVEIQKGDILTIPYTYQYNGLGTHKRQELMQSDDEFVCRCRRCSDPSELSSYTSALVCSKCKVARLLPINPLDILSDWKCDQCDSEIAFVEINCLIEDLMEKLESCQIVSDMETFIRENQGVSVHPNHWLITEAEDVICKGRARNPSENENLTMEERNKYIDYCTHILQVKNIIAPGISLERGLGF